MKYHPPKQGHYESGLTAKLMYDVVDDLIKKHVAKEDIKRRRKDSGFDSGQLWNKPSIRSELEEFIGSYLFTDLNEPLLGFEEIFKEEGIIQEQNLEVYRSNLELYYGSKDEARKEIFRLSDQIMTRGDILKKEIHKIPHLKKEKQLIKYNSKEAFGQLVTGIYLDLELTLDNFKTQHQS